MPERSSTALYGRAQSQHGNHAAWIAAVVLLAAVLGAGVFRLQLHFAPFLLLPLAAGLILGLAAGKLAQNLAVAPRRSAFAVLLLAILALASAQHLSAWRHYRAAVQRARQEHPQLEWIEAGLGSQPQPSLVEYLDFEARHGRQIGSVRLSAGWTWASWCLDALLSWLVAMAVFHYFQTRRSAHATGAQP
jgi:hypothetical protein